MQIYLAPLQGLTDRIFREAYTKHIGVFDKTFSPFIRIQHNEFYRPAQCNDILPTYNCVQKPIPQFLGNDAESFKLFEELCLKHGYNEVNINMGCPYPMVTGKSMGAGILSHPEKIKSLLEGIYQNTNLTISVKCRLGMENRDEFNKTAPVFNDFPIHEIIIHPRIGQQQYKGEIDHLAFAEFANKLKHPICYNGNIQKIEDLSNILKIYPQLDRIMIGRGILQQPFLLHDIRNEKISHHEKIAKLKNFHQYLIELCKEKYSGDQHFLKRMEELWSYHAFAFENGHKIYKQVKKSRTLSQYEEIVYSAINKLIE